MSIDESAELVEEVAASKFSGLAVGKDEVELLHEKEVMRLKKTTVLTGNHSGAGVAKRNRAQSENEIFTSNFKAALSADKGPQAHEAGAGAGTGAGG